jgi:GTPase SAR1 family protein
MKKVVLVGDANVGKTSLLVRFTDGNFVGNYLNTIGVDFKYKLMPVNDLVLKLQIW